MSEDDLPAGTTFGGFEIVGELGRGGMGCVYKAKDRSLGRLVALKVLPAALTRKESFVQRFTREARTAAKLNHPNIVHVYAFGEERGTWYLAMELVDGRSVGSYLRAGHRFSEEHAILITRHAARALGVAHEAGVVHRDVKPENLMMSKRGEVKLVDLGLAKDLEDEDAGLTHTGYVMGTPHYISPEQVRGRRGLDARTDVYSLGATLYHLATGHTPYSAPSLASLLTAHVNEPPPDARLRVPGLSEGLARVIAVMMAKEPAERYPSMRAVDDDLQRVHAGTPPLLSRSGEASTFALGADDDPMLTSDETLVPRSSSRNEVVPAGAHALPSPSSSPSPDPTPAAGQSGAADPALKVYERELARFIGPMARVVVKRAAKGARSLDELAATLAKDLPTETERAAFLSAVRKTT